MIELTNNTSLLSKAIAIILAIVMPCYGGPLAAQSATNSQAATADETTPNKLRRIFLPFEDLNDWMKGKQAYIPMSYQRYANLIAFANRKKGIVQITPRQHLLQLSSNGLLQGESLFHLPQDDRPIDSNWIDLSIWKLPAKFSAAFPDEFANSVDYLPDVPSMSLTPLQAGVDQDGRFGLNVEKNVKFVAATYELNVSTGDLFDGHRSITLPASAETQTLVEIPKSVFLIVGANCIARPVSGAASPMEDSQNKRFLVTTTEAEMTLRFSSTPKTQSQNVAPDFGYTESTKLTVTVERQDIETTILLENSGVDDTVPLEVVVPAEISCRTCFVNGKTGVARLSTNSAGQKVWQVSVTPRDFPLELILTGSLRWSEGQMLEVPRVSVKDGSFLEGTAKVEARKPAGIQDFQLINCRYENASQDSKSHSIEVRYLAPDSQCRLSLTSNDVDQAWTSFSRINFQDDYLQAEQWIDHDLTFAVQTTLPFRLERDWTVGQLVCAEISENSPTTEQTVNWYRDANDPDLLIANVPDTFLGKQIRIRFQGRRRVELGQQNYFEGLVPVIKSEWNRLVAVTSTSPTIASLPTHPFIVTIQPELARQQYSTFASLIQLEPTFQIDSETEIPFQIEYRDASSYSVTGRLENDLLNEQLLKQSFVFQLFSSGSSVQQFPIQRNVTTNETFAWDLTDSDGQSLQFIAEVDPENSSLLWFKLQEPIATTLTLRQQRIIQLPAADSNGTFELPVYIFPEAVNFQTAVIDRSSCRNELRYEQSDLLDQLNWKQESRVDELFSDMSQSISSVYPIGGVMPRVRCIQPDQNSLEPLIVSTNYQHRMDPGKVRSACVINFSAICDSKIKLTLPSGGTLDSVTLNGTRTVGAIDGSNVDISVSSGTEQTFEVRYTTTNRVELFQWSERDFRLTLRQTPIQETQSYSLTDGLGILETRPNAGFLQQLSHRWLLMSPDRDNWSYNKSTNCWHSNQLQSQGICLTNERNLLAIKWLMGQVFLIVGFLFWSSILFIGGRRWTLNAPLLLVFGLLTSVAPLPLAQVSAVACWALLGGHVLGFVRSGTQEKLKLLTPDRLMSTLSRSLLVTLLISIPCSSGTVLGQDSKIDRTTSSVVIPLDKDSKPGSVVYLDKDTYQRLGELEKEMSSDTRIEIRSTKYRLTYSPTADGFERLVCEFLISAPSGGIATIPIPIGRSDTIANMAINGTPQGFTVQDGKLRVPLPAVDDLKLSFESQIQKQTTAEYISFRTIPTLDNQLELRGVPTTWMVELYDTENAELVDRSFSKRTFQLGRMKEIGIYVAADRQLNRSPRLDTSYNVNLSRISCKTTFQLGVFRRMSNRTTVAVDSRLRLPARYYFATAGFLIDELRTDGDTTVYEVVFPNSDQIPERFDIEWETELPSVGQLHAPRIRVLSPDVPIQQYIGLSIDRRLLFQPNLASDSFSRLSGKRFPQLDNSDFNDPLDFVFSMRSTAARKEILLGELRMQPVQANGSLSLRYYVQSDRILWDFDGQIDLSLGELPQLRLTIPNGFQLDDVFLSNDFQNQILWTKILNSTEGNELICFLKEPMTGGLQIRLSGSQPVSEPIITEVFSSQLSDVRYQAFLFHSPNLDVSVETTLEPDSELVASDVQYALHSAYQLTPEMAASGRMNLTLNKSAPDQLLQAFVQLRASQNGGEQIQATIVADNNEFATGQLKLRLPAGYGNPRLTGAADPDGNIVDSAKLTEANGEFLISWPEPISLKSLQVIFPLTATTNTLEMPGFPGSVCDYYLRKNERSNSALQLDEATIAEPQQNISGFEAASTGQWYHLGQAENLQLPRRSNSSVDRLAPTIELQQFNYRPSATVDHVEQFDGVVQWIVNTRSNDQYLDIAVPEQTRVLNTWINQKPATLMKTEERNFQIALDPTEHWHVVTMRLQLPSTGMLPQLVGVAAAKQQFYPSVIGIEDTSSYRQAIADVEKAIDLPAAKQSLLIFNRNRQRLQSEDLQLATADQTSAGSQMDPSEETTKMDNPPREDVPDFDVPLASLIAQFPEKHMVPSQQLKLQTVKQMNTPSSLPRILISLLGIVVIAFLLWHPENQIRLLSCFVAIVAGTYGTVALAKTGDWMIGIPLISFGFLTLSFLIKQKLGDRIRTPVDQQTDHDPFSATPRG